MPGALPYSYLEAAVFSWPLASEGSFRSGRTLLGESRQGVLDGATEQLSTDMIAHLRPRARGVSVEVLRQVQEAVWFAEDRRARGTTRVPLEMLVGRAASRLLSFAGDRTVLRADERPLHETTARWRWTSFALPPDILIAALAAAMQQEPPSDHVTVMPAHLWAFFDQIPIANNHLHFGAAVPFELVWTNLVS